MLSGYLFAVRLHNLLVDPRERHNVAETNDWVFDPMGKMVSEFEESLRKEPPIPSGTADPYQPRGFFSFNSPLPHSRKHAPGAVLGTATAPPPAPIPAAPRAARH